MDERTTHNHAVELLQKLGFKEYEAKSFVALVRVPNATAKEVSEVSDVPRTRVYDAIRVLETKGLVEIQHSNPQQFRAVSIEEAVETLQHEYDTRLEELSETLDSLDPADTETKTEVSHEIWSLSGREAITARARQLVGDANEEILLVLGRRDAESRPLLDALEAATERGALVLVGTLDEVFRERLADEVPAAEVFVSEMDWSQPTDPTEDGTEISRLLLVDRSTMLVSTVTPTADSSDNTERAVFGEGFDNGMVVLTRRMLTSGLEAHRAYSTGQ